MNIDREVLEMVRAGQVPVLNSETLPRLRAEQEKLNARFQDAMDHGFVGGNPLPSFPAITAKAAKGTRPDRARAVRALLNATTKRRKL